MRPLSGKRPPSISHLDSSRLATLSGPVHGRVQRVLREAIEEDFLDGQRFWSENDLASSLGIARGTLRQALTALERDGHLRQLPEKRRVACKSPRELVALASDCDAQVGMEILRHLSLAASCNPREISLRVLYTRPSIDQTIHTFLGAGHTPRTVRTLIYEVPERAAPMYEALTVAGYEPVLLDQYPPGFDGRLVTTDCEAASRLAVEHLVGLGHRAIAMLQIEPTADSNVVKERAFSCIAREVGVHAVVFHDRMLPPLESFATSYRAMGEIWALDPRPTAIFALNDPSALGILKWLAERGIRVPEDVSVIGFEGTQLSETCFPSLTSVAHPMRELAEAAISVLWEDAPRKVVLAPKLIVRQSTGRAPQAK